MFLTVGTSCAKFPKRGIFCIFKVWEEDHYGWNGVNEKESGMRQG